MRCDNREKLIRKIKAIGQSLIDNAESIVGTEKHLSRLTISCYPNPFDDEIPDIHVKKSFVPETWVEEVSNANFKNRSNDR